VGGGAVAARCAVGGGGRGSERGRGARGVAERRLPSAGTAAPGGLLPGVVGGPRRLGGRLASRRTEGRVRLRAALRCGGRVVGVVVCAGVVGAEGAGGVGGGAVAARCAVGGGGRGSERGRSEERRGGRGSEAGGGRCAGRLSERRRCEGA